MKAKHFKKFRILAINFLVARSRGMFGDFDEPTYTEVLARTPKQAAYRFMKRKNTVHDLSNHDGSPEESSERFARLKVVPKATPFIRFSKFYR